MIEFLTGEPAFPAVKPLPAAAVFLPDCFYCASPFPQAAFR